MPISDFFKRWFGETGVTDPKSDILEDQKHYRHNFRNPIWQNDDDDDDDGDDFRRPGNGTHFTVDSDPMEITKFFEAEMDLIFKSFFGSGPKAFSFFMDPESEMWNQTVPSIQDKSANGCLRDQVLKPGLQQPPKFEQRVDGDIDGKVSAEELGKIWGEKNTPPSTEVVPSDSYKRSEHKGFMLQIKLGGGQPVEKHTVADSEGNVRTTCTRQIGDKKHIVTTVKDKNGVETRIERLVNMDEDDLNKFNEVWQGVKESRPGNSQQHWSGFFDGVDWNKYFGPSPKL